MTFRNNRLNNPGFFPIKNLSLRSTIRRGNFFHRRTFQDTVSKRWNDFWKNPSDFSYYRTEIIVCPEVSLAEKNSNFRRDIGPNKYIVFGGIYNNMLGICGNKLPNFY